MCLGGQQSLMISGMLEVPGFSLRQEGVHFNCVKMI